MSREPSMEEILSSIRRVMAREDAEAGKVAAPRASANGGGDDEDPFAAGQADPAADGQDAGTTEEEVLELTDTSPEPALSGDAKGNTKVSDASLLATDRVAASRQSLSQLAEAVKPAPRPDMAIGSVSLDQMVQDMVRPMLKEWLDAHLPEIVERMVSREISRITDRNY
ncbi:DUF2497 domain-containing protein [Pseudonocardia sp. TMWB2A]|uniref:DUF2497 domain-containing protein n=1 Tax=Pseudonocardia sp. TMWB2A TaxID=687430 RepID=UPI00307F013F